MLISGTVYRQMLINGTVYRQMLINAKLQPGERSKDRADGENMMNVATLLVNCGDWIVVKKCKRKTLQDVHCVTTKHRRNKRKNRYR
jgi:hypothetical protein